MAKSTAVIDEPDSDFSILTSASAYEYSSESSSSDLFTLRLNIQYSRCCVEEDELAAIAVRTILYINMFIYVYTLDCMLSLARQRDDHISQCEQLCPFQARDVTI